jgi:Monoamine oxidase
VEETFEPDEIVTCTPDRAASGEEVETGGAARVAVIGAGIAGLRVASRLEDAGLHVTILESQKRVGGRALTVTGKLSEGLLGQAGPARFLSSCTRVLRLTQKLGIPIEPFYPTRGAFAAYRGDERIADYRPGPDDFWGYDAARDLERHLSPRRWIGEHVVHPLRRALGQSTGFTFQIAGGTGRMADALASRLRATIWFGTSAQAVTQVPGGVRVDFTTEDGENGSAMFDYIVCAIPLSQIPSITFSPPLGDEKTKVARSTPFASAIRIFLEMRRPYWRDTGFNGFALVDTLGEIWDPHWAEAREPALLVCYAQSALSREIGGLNERDRIAFAIQQVERVFPGAAEHFVRGTSFFWDAQSWIGGGWPQLRGGHEDRGAVFDSPEGQIFFAGDYICAEWLNTIEGTLESADRAAEALCRVARGSPVIRR